MRWFDIHLTDSSWGKSEDNATQLRIKGAAYWDDALCTSKSLGHCLSQAQTTNDLTLSLNRLNGFYAWVEEAPGRIRAAVDHIRSRPLFYANFDGRFFLSDDAEWVRQQVGDLEMDPVAREEFQLAGYVTGSETLFPNVKQLQAGEFLVVTQQDDGITVETHRYYRFLHTEPGQVDEPELRRRLDEFAVASIKRLIDYANGRQIVVPLSGGYDSRLIVTLLKQLGYDNILTFTYGILGNKESEFSKRVADALGLRWHFVVYSEALWRQAWLTSERWAYQKWASGWNSMAHIQDWLAVKIMKEQRVLQSDCLFVPGHSGDFVAGSHIPANAFKRSRFILRNATDEVLSRHYALAPLDFFETSRETWSKRIRDRMERDGIETAWQYADVLEKWDWQERQAKYICNSVRVYEFFDYDWWVPLWDKGFVDFWYGVPLALRKEQEWYKTYVKNLYTSVTGDGALENAAVVSPVYVRYTKHLLRRANRNAYLCLYKVWKSKKYQTSPINPYFMYSFGFVSEKLLHGYTANGIYAEQFIATVASDQNPKSGLIWRSHNKIDTAL